MLSDDLTTTTTEIPFHSSPPEQTETEITIEWSLYYSDLKDYETAIEIVNEGSTDSTKLYEITQDISNWVAFETGNNVTINNFQMRYKDLNPSLWAQWETWISSNVALFVIIILCFILICGGIFYFYHTNKLNQLYGNDNIPYSQQIPGFL